MRGVVWFLVLLVVVVTLSSCKENIAGMPIHPGGDDEEMSNGMDIGDLLLGAPGPGSLPSGVSVCHQLDSDWFDAATCLSPNQQPPNSIVVQRAFKDGTYGSLCSGDMQCYLPKNIYSMYSCIVDVDFDSNNPLPQGGKCKLAAYWDDVYTAGIDICKCTDQVGYYKGYYCDGTGDYDDCFGNGIGDTYLSCGGIFEYEYCFNTEFIMKYYDNVFSTDDLWCSDQSRRTCLADPDCWPADATQEEKEMRCGGTNCFDNPYTTCVLREEGMGNCEGYTDYEGDPWQHGFNAEIKSLNTADSRYGCELAGDNFGESDCCLHDPQQLDSMIPKPEWELAYELDMFTNRFSAVEKADGTGWISYAEQSGIVLEVDWNENPSLYGDLPCEDSPCIDEFINGDITDNLYQRCFACDEYCGVNECCNGIDDDGDGRIDGQDSKCHGYIGLEEGGVCFG